MIACLFFEWAIGKFLLKKETTTICDGSAVITGVLLAFNLPSNLPVWIIILGALFAIGVGKMSFGGLGNNPFNPALAGRVFLLLSFPVQMTFLAGGRSVDCLYRCYYCRHSFGIDETGYSWGCLGFWSTARCWSLFIGNNGGCLGEVSAAA